MIVSISVNLVLLQADSKDPDAHAFLAWFDISFASTHKTVKFSTGPHAKYTHWKYVLLPSKRIST